MTQAICFRCGEIKWGALNPCDRCGVVPRSDDELTFSLAFSDHYCDPETLQQIGWNVKIGNPPEISETTRRKVSPAVAEAKRILGINRLVGRQSGPKRLYLFHSPGLAWPFFAAVASLVVIWTMLGETLRLVPSRNSGAFGLFFGALSGVVLFAIMRAYDRSQFGSKNRPTMTGDRTPTARNLLKARTPPWHQVAPIVIDAIFEALAGTELFDCFVIASMENNLLAQYERLGREDENMTIIRTQISGILCQAGFRSIAALENELSKRRIDAARKIGLSATNLFEPAIVLSKDQTAGYIGMATVYELLGIKAKSQEYAKRGLFELEKVRQSAAGRALRDSAVFPRDMLDRAERQLRGYLE